MIRLFIAGRPVPQARPRTFWHRAAGKFVTTNPRDCEQWKEKARLLALPHRPREPIDFPVRVILDFYVPRPKGAKDAVWACVRPDLDNYAKAVLDALQQAQFFTDDSRVVWLECRKLYSQNGEIGVRITLLGVDEKL